jgi:hypothetical protein
MLACTDKFRGLNRFGKYTAARQTNLFRNPQVKFKNKITDVKDGLTAV